MTGYSDFSPKILVFKICITFINAVSWNLVLIYFTLTMDDSVDAFCVEVVLNPDFLHADVPATQGRDLS